MSDILTYIEPTQQVKDLVNQNKILEEGVLKIIDLLQTLPDLDQECISLGSTKLTEAFMWINRGIFKPQRLKS